MTGELLAEYDKVLEKLENMENVTKAMVFHVLAINDKTKMEKLMKMSDKEFLMTLEKPMEEVLYILMDK